jgi:GNAT superfamily N-acetyltransferase
MTGDVLAIRLLDSADDGALADALSRLVNSAYATAERGLWLAGATRTTPSQLGELIRSGEIAVATRGGHIAGCVRVREIAPRTGELGMLVAAPEVRGSGVGRALVAFAERHVHDRGLHAMQLELLVPRDRPHPSKAFLRAWYARCGYRRVLTRSFDDAYPHVAPLLVIPCDLEVHEKPLTATRCPARRHSSGGRWRRPR